MYIRDSHHLTQQATHRKAMHSNDTLREECVRGKDYRFGDIYFLVYFVPRFVSFSLHYLIFHYLIFLVLPSIWKAWNDGRYSRGRCDFACIYHDEQLHQVVVDFARAGLNDVDIFATHRLADFNAEWGDKVKTTFSDLHYK